MYIYICVCLCRELIHISPLTLAVASQPQSRPRIQEGLPGHAEEWHHPAEAAEDHDDQTDDVRRWAGGRHLSLDTDNMLIQRYSFHCDLWKHKICTVHGMTWMFYSIWKLDNDLYVAKNYLWMYISYI